MFKFIHTSDIHLGAKLAWLKDKSKNQRDQLYKTFENIVELSIEKNVNAIFICGDLFDQPCPDLSLERFVFAKLSELSTKGIHVFITPGNHDYLSENSPYKKWKNSDYFHVFSKKDPQVFEIQDLGLAVYGQAIVTAKSHNDFESILELYRNNAQSKYNVCVFHGGFDIGQKSVSKNISTADISKSGFDYIAMGDWHGYLDISSGSTKAIYPGSPEIIAIDQTKAGNVVYGELDGTNKNIEQIRVGRLNVQELEYKNRIEKNNEGLIEFLNKLKNKNLALKVIVTGKKDLLDPIDFEGIQDRCAEEFFYLQIEDETNIEITEEELDRYPQELLVGRYIKLVQEEIINSKSEEEKSLLKEVLQEGVKRLIHED